MKIHVTPKDFLSKFRLAASVASNTDFTSTIHLVKITADRETGSVLQATDGDVAIWLRTDCDIATSGEALLPSKRLAQILTMTTEEQLTIERAEREVSISGEYENYSMSTPLPDEFPDIEEFEATAYHEIPASILRETIRRTVFAVDAENLKYALGGVCFSMDGDAFSAVATNGVRLAWQEGYGKCVNDHNADAAIVSAKTLQVLDRFLGDNSIGDDDAVRMVLRVKTDDKNMTSGTVMFQCKDITLVARLIHGRFPKWEKTIPATDGKTLARIPSGELLRAALIAQAGTDDKEPGILCTFADHKIALQGQAMDKGTTTIKQSLIFCKEARSVKLNAKYIVDVLRVLPAETELTFYLPEDNDPVKIVAEKDGYVYVIMPMSK